MPGSMGTLNFVSKCCRLPELARLEGRGRSGGLAQLALFSGDSVFVILPFKMFGLN